MSTITTCGIEVDFEPDTLDLELVDLKESKPVSIVLRVTLPVEVEFEYLPAEPDNGIPREDIEVRRVELGGIDVTEGLEADDIETIATAILEAKE